MLRQWPNIVTVSCIVIAAIVEAWQEALSHAPVAAQTFPKLEGIWHYVPLLLLIVAGTVWMGGYLFKRFPGQGRATKALATLAASPTDLDSFLKRSYNTSPLEPEVKENVRHAVERYPSAERDEFVLKFIARGILNYAYDETWWTIY